MDGQRAILASNASPVSATIDDETLSRRTAEKPENKRPPMHSQYLAKQVRFDCCAAMLTF